MILQKSLITTGLSSTWPWHSRGWIYCTLPTSSKEDAFIHRNGRTARMNAKGFVYLIMKEDDNFPFLEKDIPCWKCRRWKQKSHSKQLSRPFYISAGKKDKVNKVDIVGYLIKKGIRKRWYWINRSKGYHFLCCYIQKKKKIPELLKSWLPKS